MKNPIKVLSPNKLGKDYVIGDLHGEFEIFQNLLKGISFNKEIDRIISVGDLIDRGPSSLECLSLLHESWFHSVLGNHEQMMLGFFARNSAGAYWMMNGGNWAMEAYNDITYKNKIPNDSSVALATLLPIVDELPFIITVETNTNKKYHVIHAEYPKGHVVTDKILANNDTLIKLATVPDWDGDSMVWSRTIFGGFYYQHTDLSNKNKLVRTAIHQNVGVFNKELSHTISGHTIVRSPLTVVGQTNIDTGAYHHHKTKWAGLTCVELNSWKFYHVTITNFKEISPINISRSDVNVAYSLPED